MPPESRIVEQNLAEELNVSRTPVREAIQRLVHEGLLVSIPNLGTFIKRFSVNDVREIFEIREVLEGLAFRNAAELFIDTEVAKLKRLAIKTDAYRERGEWSEAYRSDESFHRFIIDRSGNEELKRELDKFSFQTLMFQADLTPIGKRTKRRKITVTHKELADVAKDPLNAEKLMRKHIAGLAQWIFG